MFLYGLTNCVGFSYGLTNCIDFLYGSPIVLVFCMIGQCVYIWSTNNINLTPFITVQFSPYLSSDIILGLYLLISYCLLISLYF